MEWGRTLEIRAEASDGDGRVEEVLILLNDSVYKTIIQPPYTFQWDPAPGVYKVAAAAVDNGGDTVVSEAITIEVFQQNNYSASPFLLPGVIEAEDYDLGGPLVAFEDADPANQGGLYRNDAVDIGSLSNGNSGYYVGWTERGEWLEYTLECPEAQKVELLLMAASETGGGEIYLELDDVAVTNHQFIQSTGGDQVYDTLRIEDLYLHKGIHKLKMQIVEGGFNLDRIEIAAYDLFILGIPEFAGAISLYPNPAASSIRINLPGDRHREIQIWSLNGKLQRKIEVFNEREMVIHIEDLTQGVYLLNLVSENQVYRVKFVKL
jgi:hypothetical protein